MPVAVGGLGRAAGGQHVGAEPGAEQHDVRDDRDDGRDEERSSRRCRCRRWTASAAAASMTVTGLPSARIRASPEAADRVPSVTMKSVILPCATSRPLTTPTTARGHGRQARRPHRPQPCGVGLAEGDRAQGHRGRDRQVDARRGDDEGLADRQDDQDRGGDQHRLDVAGGEERRSSALWKMTTRTTRPTRAAHSAQKPTSFSACRQVSAASQPAGRHAVLGRCSLPRSRCVACGDAVT